MQLGRLANLECLLTVAIQRELRPIYLDRLQRKVGQYSWVRVGSHASLTMLLFVVLASVTMLFFVGLVSALVATTCASPTKTPVVTCCPPGSFLAIEDWQESRQLPNGLWADSVTLSNGLWVDFKRQITPPMWSFKPGESDNIATLSDYNTVSRYGRHNYILGVSCVPDKNNLHPIDGFRGSQYPDPPYFASLQDKMLGLETRKGSKPLADSQILQSTGM